MISIRSNIRRIQNSISVNISDKTCLLYFHQGWTDIINCLSLITYFTDIYNKVYLIVRKDSKPLIEFYTSSIKNIFVLYEEHKTLDTIGWRHLTYNIQIDVFEFIGGHDFHRPITDNFKNAYNRFIESRQTTFERAFYESYNIPYITRCDKFNLLRDYEKENIKYNQMVKSENYICIHTNPDLKLYTIDETSNKYDQIIQLNKSSDMFFDMIKILENAKEIHVIDSVWAAICYLLDTRYGLFKDIPVYVYCHRNFSRMFTEPIHLQNWNIITFN